MNQIKHFAFPIALGCLLIVAASAVTAHAQAPDPAETASSSGFDIVNDLAKPVLLAVVWTFLGVILFAVSIKIMVMLSPFSVQKEIEEDQNTSLGIIMGAVILGIAIILAAAIIG